MTEKVILQVPRSGPDTSSQIIDVFRELNPDEIVIVSAFVTREAVDFIANNKPRAARVVLLAGISNHVTEPSALEKSLSLRWPTRVASSRGSIFHPKFMLFGQRCGSFLRPEVAYIGSSNLTGGGLFRNIELGIVTASDTVLVSLEKVFVSLWARGDKLSKAFLSKYTNEFSKALAKRSKAELVSLYGQRDIGAGTHQAEQANLVWVGVESFTGFNFQIEFPKRVGIAFRSLIGRKQFLNIRCSDRDREMKFDYYRDNGMFRLNIPNDTPGIRQAREKKTGIIVIRKISRDGVDCSLEYIANSAQMREVMDRSEMIGCYGITRTRKYGWI